MDFASKTIPLRAFGDGVAVLGVAKSWGRSVDAYTLQPLLSLLPAKFGTVLMALVWKGKRHANLLPRLWKILVWSLKALFSGRWPSTDWQDQAFPDDSEDAKMANRFLAGGYSAAIVVLCLAWAPSN